MFVRTAALTVSRSFGRTAAVSLKSRATLTASSCCSYSNGTGGSAGTEFGRGAGMGGGSGGSIREAGGIFGKLEAAREEEYFYKLQKAQLRNMKEDLAREIEQHELHMHHHEEAIARHKKRIDEFDSEEKEIEKERKS